jgi:Fur family peroxide stress response transcriptional regulator
MQIENPVDRISTFIEFCQEHHLKITPQRVAIYKELINLDTHPTADDIYQLVKKEYPNMSFDTVNRTLQTFAAVDLVDVVEIFGGAKRFDPDLANHHHLHCIRCGAILDFSSRIYDNLEVPDDIGDQFQVLRKRVVLIGLCKACRK